MKFSIEVVPYEAFDDPLIYLKCMLAVAKEGTLAMELNRMVIIAVYLAERENFTPTEDYGLGNLYADKCDKGEVGEIEINLLNMVGSVYFKTEQYPVVYTADENQNVIDIAVPETTEK